MTCPRDNKWLSSHVFSIPFPVVHGLLKEQLILAVRPWKKGLLGWDLDDGSVSRCYRQPGKAGIISTFGLGNCRLLETNVRSSCYNLKPDNFQDMHESKGEKSVIRTEILKTF